MPIRFSEADFERVRAAVVAAEQQTAGEIVPVVVVRSGSYPEALWKGAALCMALMLLLSLIFVFAYTGWGATWFHTGWGVALLTLLAGSLGGLAAAYVEPFQRWLIGEARLAEQVHLRALEAFVEEEVFRTQDRTGILIFVSLFEHWVEVVGDAGINQRVDPDTWAVVVDLVRQGIRRGQLVDGIVAAVDRCGQLLAEHGVTVRPSDVNELDDALRIRTVQQKRSTDT